MSSSSLAGQKRSEPEAEIDPDCKCAVCFEVLLDPVTLPCGHSLDQRCLQKVLDSGGQRACPTCRKKIPADPPAISRVLCAMLERSYPRQVRRLFEMHAGRTVVTRGASLQQGQ